jgi:hypothetical protein
MEMPGTWTQLPADAPAHSASTEFPTELGYDYDFWTCPFQLKYYACEALNPATQAAVKFINQRTFEPDVCQMRPWPGREFANQCDGGNMDIHFIGDSLNHQYMMGFACALHRTFGEYLSFDAPGRVADCPTPSDPGWHEGHCWWSFGTVTVPNQIRTTTTYIQRLVTENFAYEVSRLTWMKPFDARTVIVLSIGIFYGGNVPEVREAYEFMLRYLDSINYPGRILIRDYVPSHVYTFEGGKQSGCRNHDAARGEYSSPIFKDTIYEMLNACLAGEALDGGFGSGPAPVGTRCGNVRTIPVYESALSQGDAHAGGFSVDPLPGQGENLDCTHYCSPSAAVSLWSTMLFNIVCNEY